MIIRFYYVKDIVLMTKRYDTPIVLVALTPIMLNFRDSKNQVEYFLTLSIFMIVNISTDYVKVSVSMVDVDGKSALHHLASNTSSECAHAILHGTPPSSLMHVLNLRDVLHHTALHDAIMVCIHGVLYYFSPRAFSPPAGKGSPRVQSLLFIISF